MWDDLGWSELHAGAMCSPAYVACGCSCWSGVSHNSSLSEGMTCGAIHTLEQRWLTSP
jgi:hypothetical protein